MRVTLDTNVYVSALHFGGKPMQLLQMGLEGELAIAVSQPILDETLRVLREKFGWPDDGLRDAEASIDAATYLAVDQFRGMRVLRVREFLDGLQTQR